MAIRKRDRPAGKRPLAARDDFAFAAELPILWALALALPEPRRHRACARLEAAKAALRFFDPAPVARIAARVPGAGAPGFDAQAFAIDSAAGRGEHHLQVLRAISPGSWKAPVPS